MNIPDNNVGVIAFGVKTGIVTSDDDVVEVVKATIKKNPDVIMDNDILCITETIVAVTQGNFIKLSEVTSEIKATLDLREDSTIGVIHPILSRNRFSMMLKAIARAVPRGKVIIQLMFPDDEQGNPIIAKETLKKLDKASEDIITLEDIGQDRLMHPETGLDYIDFYQEIVGESSAEVEIFLSNTVDHMLEKAPDAIMVSNVHARADVLEEVKGKKFNNVITLQDICCDPNSKVYSEFGLLGSNILDPHTEQLKLCPRNPDKVCEEIRLMIALEFDKEVDVLIYGDGAYKDPESGIFELADPLSCFGSTSGIKNRNRIGVKTKYLMQKLYNEGKSKEEITLIIEEERRHFIKVQDIKGFSAQGTTPRKIENLVSSLADLVSGSADSGTPIVVVRNFG